MEIMFKFSIFVPFTSFALGCAAFAMPEPGGVRGEPRQLGSPFPSPPITDLILPLEHRTPLHRRQEVSISEADYQIFYNAKVLIDNRSFSLLVDTGSSITWVTSPSVTCRNTFTGAPCTYTTNHLTATNPIDHLFVPYMDGSNVTGSLVRRSFSFPGTGLTIPNQVVGVADHLFTLLANKQTDGLLGLGGTAELPYPPVFPSLASLGLLKRPIFSIALLGDAGMETYDKGVLAFGGVPSAIATSSQWGVANLVAESPYQILVDDFRFVGAEAAGKKLPADDSWRQVLVDSGTYYTKLAGPIAEAIFEALPGTGTPNAKCTGKSGEKCKDENGYWKVPCDVAKAPAVGVVVGGVELPFKKENLIVRHGENYCVSGIVPQRKGDVGILGVTFMKGVVVAHDYSGELAVMAIAAKE